MIKNINITKAIFVLTGTYNDMSLRPYETNMDGRSVEMFREATHDGTSISPSAISGAANIFLRPSATHREQVNIENGWATPRFRFIIETLEESGIGGFKTRKILQGYTGYAGVSNNLAVDPQMGLHFNNVMTLRDTLIETPYGQNLRSAVSETNQILTGAYNPSFDSFNANSFLLRPEDVFGTMSKNELGDGILDTRAMFSESPVKKSKRKNGSAAHYVASVMSSYRDNVAHHGADEFVGMGGPMDNARGMVKEDLMSADPFFTMLNQITSNFVNGGFVTYGELLDVFPELDHVSTFILDRTVNRNQPGYVESHQVGQSEHWNGADMATMWATILTQSVPSIMMDIMLSKVSFTAHNQTVGNEIEVWVEWADGITKNIDLGPYVNIFIGRLKSEILKGLSNNHSIIFSLKVFADVLGETRMTITIEGDHPVEFVAPSFSDGLYAPVMTTENGRIDRIAHDLQMMGENVGIQTSEKFSYETDWNAV